MTWGDRPGTGRERGAVAVGLGVGAWLLGYAFTVVLWLLSEATAPADLTSGVAWKAIGWAFYGLHLVPVTGSGATNAALALGGPLVVGFVVPPVLLALAGMVLASDTRAGPAAGGLVAFGYLPATVLGATAFRASAATGGVGPDPAVAVVAMGVVYPVVGGLFGGLVGA